MRNCAALLLFLGSCPALNCQVPNLRKPNLVLVTIDTLRADRLGCYGYSKIQTPNLDQFARKGVLFENAVTHTPLTAPSHASLFTGLYPTVHGVRDTGGFILPSSQLTIAEILRQQGWDTAAFVGSSVLKKHFASTTDSPSTMTRCPSSIRAKRWSTPSAGPEWWWTERSAGWRHNSADPFSSGYTSSIRTLHTARRRPSGKNTGPDHTTER